MTREIADMHGKTAIVTGANAGIGWVTARSLAQAGARVWIGCRTLAKAQAASAQIRAEVPNADLRPWQLDLGDLAQVRTSAQEFLDSSEPLDLLVNNAGLAGSQGVTHDGFEIHFGTNHLGPYLLTRLLLSRLQAQAASRIVLVASRGHYRSKGLIWGNLQQPTKTKAGFNEYCDSKLANVLTAKTLSERLKGTGVTVYSLHPGVVASEIWRRVPQPFRWVMLRFMITVEQGAQTSLYCATSPQLASESGLYYDKCKAVKPSRLARDATLAQELWQRSAQWVGLEP